MSEKPKIIWLEYDVRSDNYLVYLGEDQNPYGHMDCSCGAILLQHFSNITRVREAVPPEMNKAKSAISLEVAQKDIPNWSHIVKLASQFLED